MAFIFTACIGVFRLMGCFRPAPVARSGTGGPVRQPWRRVVALSLLDALLRALDGQRRQAEAAGVRIALTVPNTPRLRDAAPKPLPRALPALVRAALAAMAPGEALEVRIDIVTSELV